MRFTNFFYLSALALFFVSCEQLDVVLHNAGKDRSDKLPQEVIINEPALFPEGVAYDPYSNHFLVSSVTRGTIGTVDDQGNYEIFVEDDDFVTTLGLEVDEHRQRLLVCVADANTGSVAALGSYDLRSGERLFLADLTPVAGDAAAYLANDVAVDPYGNAYVTDSFLPIIYKVDQRGEASVFLRDEAFQPSAPGAIGLNGIAYHPDGYLIAAFSETATLYKIPVDSPANFTAIDVQAGAVTTPDGLSFSKDYQSLEVVNNERGGDNGRVTVIGSSDQWATAQQREVFLAGPVSPTTMAQRGSKSYVLYAYLHELNSGNTSRSTFEIVRLDFDRETGS